MLESISSTYSSLFNWKSNEPHLMLELHAVRAYSSLFNWKSKTPSNARKHQFDLQFIIQLKSNEPHLMLELHAVRALDGVHYSIE